MKINAVLRKVVMVCVGFGLAWGGPLQAATWNGGGSDNNWSNGDNWGGAAPADGAALAFGGVIRLNNTNNFAGYSFAGITFNSGAGAFVLAGNTFTNTANTAFLNSGANAQTVNPGVVLGYNGDNYFKATSGDLVFGGPVSLNNYTLRVDNSSGYNVTFSGGVEGNGKVGVYQGNVSMPASNTFVVSELRVQGNGCVLDLGATNTIVATNVYIQGTGTVKISGGSLIQGGDNTMALGGGSTDNAKLYVSGNATLTYGAFKVSQRGTGTVHQSGGMVRAINGYGFYMNQYSGASGTYNLSGGELQANMWQGNAAEAFSAFNLSGGTIRPFNNNLTIQTPLTLAGDNGTLNSTDSLGSGRTLSVGQPIGETGGAHNLMLAGIGTIKLATNTLYSGVTTLSGGTLSISHPMALQNSTLNYTNGTVTFATGITAAQFGGLKGTSNLSLVNASSEGVALTVSNTATMTYGGVLSDNSKTGSLTKAGSGILILTNTSTYIGGTMINNGILQLGDGVNNGALVGSITNNSPVAGGLTFNNGTDQTVTNVVSGTGSLRKDGSGVLTLVGANTYGGSTIVGAGALVVGSVTNLHQFKKNATANRTESNCSVGTVFKVNPSMTIIVTQLGVLDNGGDGLANPHNVFLYDNSLARNIAGGTSAVPSGTSAPYANGYRFATLPAPITLSGGIAGATNTVWCGTTGDGDNWSNGGGQTYDYGASGELAWVKGVQEAQSNTYPHTYSASDYTFVSFLFYDPNADITLGAVAASTPVQIGSTGVLNLSAGNQQVASLSDFGAAGGVVTRSEAGATTLTLGADSGSSTFSGVIQDGSGILSVVKTGAGTQILAGNNTYTGGTTISNGTLVVNGSLAGPVTVCSNGFLGGTGTVSGAVTMLAGASLGNTNSIDNLTLNAPTLNGTLWVNVASNGVCDHLQVTGALAVTNMTLNIVDTNQLNSAQIYVIASSTGVVTGPFASVGNLPATWRVRYGGNQITLEAPAPGFMLRVY